MRSVLILVVALLGAVSAQNKWPMISVNAAGEIVLQSLTRAQSFVFTPLTVNTGPTTGSASATTATRLSSGPNVFRVLIPSGAVANAGVTLPSPVQGQTITLLESDTTFSGSYVIWTDTGVFINADSTTQSLTVSNRRTTCVAVTSNRWDCSADAAGGLTGASIAIAATSTTASLSAVTTATVSSSTGGVTLTSATVTTINGAGTVSIAPTSTAAGAVAIAPTAGGVTITAASTKNIALTTSGAAGVLSLTSAAGGVSLTPGAGGLKVTLTAGAVTTAFTGATSATGQDAAAVSLCIVKASGAVGYCDGTTCQACTAFA